MLKYLIEADKRSVLRWQQVLIDGLPDSFTIKLAGEEKIDIIRNGKTLFTLDFKNAAWVQDESRHVVISRMSTYEVTGENISKILFSIVSAQDLNDRMRQLVAAYDLRRKLVNLKVVPSAELAIVRNASLPSVVQVEAYVGSSFNATELRTSIKVTTQGKLEYSTSYKLPLGTYVKVGSTTDEAKAIQHFEKAAAEVKDVIEQVKAAAEVIKGSRDK